MSLTDMPTAHAIRTQATSTAAQVGNDASELSAAATTASAKTTDAADRLPDRFGVLPWLEPETDDVGHDARSAYVETFWLPVVGPSTTLLLRRLADEFDAEPKGFEIDVATLSRDIGLGTRVDLRGSIARTIDRCTKFNLIQQQGDVLYVRRRVPPLGRRQIKRLSTRLQALHHSWTIDPADDGAERRTEMVRAAHLARTLLALGESTHEAERQLHQWHFHPSIAWHAVQWALTDPDHTL